MDIILRGVGSYEIVAIWIILAFQKHHCTSSMEDGWVGVALETWSLQVRGASDLVKIVVMGLEQNGWI